MSESVTRSPIELFWTAKKIQRNACTNTKTNTELEISPREKYYISKEEYILFTLV